MGSLVLRGEETPHNYDSYVLSVDVMLSVRLECDIHTIVTLKQTSRLWNEVLDHKLIYKKLLDHSYFFTHKPSFITYKQYFSLVRDHFFHTSYATFLYHNARREDALDRFKVFSSENKLDIRYTQWIRLPPMHKLDRVPHLKDEILRYDSKIDGRESQTALKMYNFVSYYGDFWLKNVRYADYSQVYYSDYVDYIDWEAFNSGECVLRGTANGQRPFFSIRFMDEFLQAEYVITCFQRLTQRKEESMNIYFGASCWDFNISSGCINLLHNARELLFLKMLLVFGEAHLVINGRSLVLRRWAMD